MSNNSNDLRRKRYTNKELMKFVIPSIIGLFLFIIPLPYKGDFSIGVGMMASEVKGLVGAYLPGFMAIVIVLSGIITLYANIFKPKAILDNDFLKNTFICKPLWVAFRVVGGIFAALTFFEAGSEIIYSPATGGTMLNDLMPTLATWFFFSCFFLPFLMQFGLMDFVGTLIRKVMKPLFLVPGRAAIDAIASWIGSGPVGVVITNKQYKSGFYTAKEAAIIASCFSLVSLPFAVVVAEFLQLQHVFLQFYGTICIASFICAIVLARLYPLRKIKDEYHPEIGKQISEEVPEGVKLSNWAVEKGVERAAGASSLPGLAWEGLKTVIDVYIGLMPLVMCWGTFALIVEAHTPIFQWIAIPFIYLLDLFGLPASETAGPAIVVGFADMFLPSILVANVKFEITRFVIGALSFTQLIYMTETGAVILRSEIPLNFKDLFIIFIERTLITLPIIIIIANIIF